MEQERFEVGQWVWVWGSQQWGKIKSIADCERFVRLRLADGEEVRYLREGFTANPVIPPPPKRMVKKEGWVPVSCIVDVPCGMDRYRSGDHVVRVTYEVEE